MRKEEEVQIKGWRDEDEALVWLTVLLLFTLKTSEHKAPLVSAILLGFGANNQMARVSTLSPPYTPSLHLPLLFCRSLQRFISTLTVSFTQQSICIWMYLFSGCFTMRKTEITGAPWLSTIPCFHIKWKKGNEHMIKDQWSQHYMLFWWTDSI